MIFFFVLIRNKVHCFSCQLGTNTNVLLCFAFSYFTLFTIDVVEIVVVLNYHIFPFLIPLCITGSLFTKFRSIKINCNLLI